MYRTRRLLWAAWFALFQAPPKVLVPILFGLMFITTTHAAPESEPLPKELELIPDKKSMLLEESMLWDRDISLRAGLGYKDNVLLSPAQKHGSAFFTSGLDLLVLRLPLDGLGINFAITGDDIRYWHRVRDVDSEDSLLATARLEKDLGSHWQAALEGKYLYMDEVATELVETGGVHTVVALGHTLGANPSLKRFLTTNWWAQFEAPFDYEWWDEPLDALWKAGAQGSIGYNYGFGSQVELTLGFTYLAHQQWHARYIFGIEIPDKKLQLWRPSAEVKWEHIWDARKRWRSTSRLGFQYNQDNGEGFFDYFRYQLGEDLRFNVKDWEAKASLALSYFTFRNQTINPIAELPPQDFPPGPVPAPEPNPRLNLVTLNVTIRAERRVYKTWRLFGQYEHERGLSNQPESRYSANVVSGGISYEF
jgi:hypothetical protein